MTTPSIASSLRSRLSAWSAAELQPNLLLSSLLTGGLIYVLEVVFAVSFTALVYTNELANYLPLAVGFTLLGDAVLCGIVAVLVPIAARRPLSRMCPSRS